MANLQDIRIVKLEPSSVASYRAISNHPENDALRFVMKWAEERDLLSGDTARIFGFDNPGPSKNQSEYGYEVWLTVDPGVNDSAEIEIKDFRGGLYAVKRTNLPQIGEAWQYIVEWCRNSKYVRSKRQCLEEHLNFSPGQPFDSVVIDLFLPVEEK